ncbi:SH3 domain-containing protein [Arenibaculum sp.]|jgi:SH3-like domain-containing protein|uniref:SH3 domain-containing protein n=1 Tax=Arenibaculum sp. TaxID=2865862 RepID=UPI002E142539|nr:SH3 domain-containing protein [Arenibaculum sp.]
MFRAKTLLLLACLLPALPAGIAAAQAPAAGVARPTGLPIPRFVTLRSGEVNVRTGPGTRYPVEWVFVRKDVPVEITAEFDTWRRIRDWEGAEGWVHQSMLSGRRAIVVTGDVRSLRRSPEPAASAVARLEPGVVGTLQRCRADWCEVEVEGYEGWLARTEFWGVYPEEQLN